MITYSDMTFTGVRVYLESVYVGKIKCIEEGWQYFPKRHKIGGKVFSTLVLCKRSLEEE